MLRISSSMVVCVFWVGGEVMCLVVVGVDEVVFICLILVIVECIGLLIRVWYIIWVFGYYNYLYL